MDISTLLQDIPTSVGIVIVLMLVLRLTDRLMERRASVTEFTRQLTMICLTLIAALLALLALPNSVVTNAEVIRLVGVAATVIVTLASTTLLGNAMAGLMLRNVKSFRPGDFVRIGEHFGRVSDRGLFHVEIQTVKRDLVTIPNQFLITRPVTVVRSSGTVITADVSLGYDTAHQVVEPILMEAAERAGLTEPFVHVLELGDYTVTYRIAGFLSNVKTLFTAQSSLHRRVLDSLHDAGVEIASPLLVGHRGLSESAPLIPRLDQAVLSHREEDESAAPSELIFDKAEEAAAEDRAQTELDSYRAEAKELERSLKDAPDSERPRIEDKMDSVLRKIEVLDAELEAMEEMADD